MPIYALEGIAPQFRERGTCWIADDAMVVGNVAIGADVSIWFGCAIRGDNERILIGDRTNIQEHTVMHTDPGKPITIGMGCTIGHRALLHGCTIEANSLIGMGAIVLNGARIATESLVGAGALVTEGKSFPPRSLIVGSPARAVRTLTDGEVDRLRASADHYVDNKRRFATGLVAI